MAANFQCMGIGGFWENEEIMLFYLKVIGVILLCLIITGVVILLPAFLIYWLLRTNAKYDALERGNRLPLEIKRQLSDPSSFVEVSENDRKQYVRRNLRKGLVIYFIFLVSGIIATCIADKPEEMKGFFLISLGFLAFIMLFVLKDFLLAKSRSKIYRMKVYMFPAYSAQWERIHWVYYYDFKQYIYVGNSIAVPNNDKTPRQGIVEVLAIEKKKKLKVLSIYMPDETSIL